MNHYHVEAERIPYAKLNQLITFAESIGVEVITCFMDNYLKDFGHIVFIGDQPAADQITAFAHQLNGGSYCLAKTITEQDIDGFFD
jgi:hypothetical protein